MKKNIKFVWSGLLSVLWMMLLTFPIMVIKVNPIDSTIQWRWMNILWVGLGTLVLTGLWRLLLNRKNRTHMPHSISHGGQGLSSLKNILKRARKSILLSLMVIVVIFPFVVNNYQVSIMTSALMFVILGLGLNIVIGYGGLLNLGYASFYAVGAYSYGLLFLYFGLSFWVALPLGALSGLLFGLLIGFPILRLRGDYLAIVTLAFGEIVRLLLEGLSGFTMGAQGIALIPRPTFITKLSLQESTVYLYYIVILLVVLSIFLIRRLENSRVGRALEAMRDDDIAAQAMGIDITKAKLTTFALGALWAGLVGVVFAGKVTYINPGSFTLMESVMILVAVVLGGTGSIPGVILGAFLVTLIPEYFRILSDYRMLMFGFALLLMSIFRPQGIIPKVRNRYRVDGEGA